MRLKNIFLFIIASLLFSSCYEDLGTDLSDYRELNEIIIEGIDSQYQRDVDDILEIKPSITGTLYSDESKFNFYWEIANQIVSNELNLELKIDMLPGNKVSRFIVEDKETGVKSYFRFDLNVSSSTAGNLIMVLSKSKGKAELSYLRLDKAAEWAINFFETRYERPLGTNPQRLDFLMVEASRIQCYPFVNAYGRIMVLVDNQLALLDKRTLDPDPTEYLTGEAYTGVASYPPPNTAGYKPEFFKEGISIWRSNAYGTGFQQMTEFQLISGGAIYFATLAPSVWTPSFYYNRKSVYGEDGYFSPFGFYDGMIPTADNNLFQHGYSLGYFVVFDRTYGRFAYSSYGTSYAIPTTNVKEFPGHDLIYGSATSESGTSFVVMKTPSNATRFLLLGKSGTTYSLAGEISGGVSKVDSKFYNMKTSPYVFFTSENKLYKYNILDVKSNVTPSESHAVVDLTSLGYGSDAKITAITVSRTESTLLLGVSRYGSDASGNGDENKGDVLLFNLDKSSLNLTLKEKYTGVAGIPVDLKIKYQTHWRDGKSNGGVSLMDNI